MENTMDKVVEGITYTTESVKQSGYNCDNCVGNVNAVLCDALEYTGCSTHYVFKVKAIQTHTNVNDIAPTNRPSVPPAPIQKASEAHQGVKTDTGKPRFTLIPPFALEQMAICLTEGLITHPDKDNWKLVEDGKARFLDSLYRHWNQYQMGEVFDRDNPNVRNLAAIMVNAAFALEFEVNPELNGTKEKTND